MSYTDDDLAAAAYAAATDPKSSEADGVRVVGQDASQAVEALKFVAAAQGAAKKGRGLRFTKLVPPGTV
jgi:hypothetical protein